MSNRVRYLWLGLLLVVLVVLSFVVSANVHKESRRQWTDGLSWQDITRGKLYGLQEFLKHAQPQANIVAYRQWPLFADDKKIFGQSGQLLFVENSSGADLANYQALLRWVAQGNHVVLPMPLALETTPALDEGQKKERTQRMTRAVFEQWLQRNLHIRWLRQPQKMAVDAEVSVASELACDAYWQDIRAATARVGGQQPATETVQKRHNLCTAAFNHIVLPEGATLAWVDYAQASFQWQPNASVMWSGRGLSGSHIVRVAYGRGSVVLLSSIGPLSNPDTPDTPVAGIDRFDHAYLADYLAQGKTHIVLLRHLATLQEQPDAPAWWRLWQAQPVLMSVLLLGIVILVWFLAKRVGSIHHRPHDDVRDWAHYLHMQGRFLRHHSSRADAVQCLQSALWAQWQRRWPDWNLLENEVKVQRLCRVYHRISRQDALRWLMAVSHEVSEQNWLRYVQSHQRFGASNKMKRDGYDK